MNPESEINTGVTMNPESEINTGVTTTGEFSATSCYDLSGLSEALAKAKTTTAENNNNMIDDTDSLIVDANATSSKIRSALDLTELDSALYESELLHNMKCVKSSRTKILAKITKNKRKIKSKNKNKKKQCTINHLEWSSHLHCLDVCTYDLEEMMSDFKRNKVRPSPNARVSSYRSRLTNYRSGHFLCVPSRGRSPSSVVGPGEMLPVSHRGRGTPIASTSSNNLQSNC